MRLPPGTTLGTWRIERATRETETRTIYDAASVDGARTVSLHTLADPDPEDYIAQKSLMTEAMVCAQLDSRHSLGALDFGQAGGVSYLVTPRLSGSWLSDTIAEHGALAEADAVRWLAQALEALEELHRKGYIHRDVKPANMHVADGQLILGGFGTALAIGKPALRGEEFVGTPAYMAPEQATNPNVDARADVWAWGVSLYEALSGRLPFSGPDLRSLFATARSEPPRPLAEVSAHVARIVDRCLAKDPSARFQSVAEITRALRPD